MILDAYSAWGLSFVWENAVQPGLIQIDVDERVVFLVMLIDRDHYVGLAAGSPTIWGNA